MDARACVAELRSAGTAGGGCPHLILAGIGTRTGVSAPHDRRSTGGAAGFGFFLRDVAQEDVAQGNQAF